MTFHMKRTTLILDDHRLVELKRMAAERGQTLSALVDELLLAGLHRAKTPRPGRARRALLSFHMGKPRVNLADRDQLYQWMDGA